MPALAETGGARPVAESAPAVSALLLALWRLARPEIWLVTVVPYHVGWVLATREALPGFAGWAAFWAKAAADGATTDEFLATLAAWQGEAGPWILGAVVLGPLLWFATLLVNDAHDLPTDLRNPRKAGSPLVRGIVRPALVLRAWWVAAGATLLAAFPVGPGFAALVAACLLLAWAYSAPPLRLKERPGADVLVNAVGVGLLAGAAGWSLARPLAEAPWVFLPQSLLLVAAVYIPTTLVDHEADAAAGMRTFATVLGPRRAYLAGFGAWVAANAGALLLAWNGWILPRAMFPLLVLFTPLLVWQYHAFIGGARDPYARIQGILLCSLTFAAVNAVFVLLYTGLWRA